VLNPKKGILEFQFRSIQTSNTLMRDHLARTREFKVKHVLTMTNDLQDPPSVLGEMSCIP
jgi:hypothetical protein